MSTEQYIPGQPLQIGQRVGDNKVVFVAKDFATLTGTFPLRAQAIQALYDNGWEVLHPPVKTRSPEFNLEHFETTLKRLETGQ